MKTVLRKAKLSGFAVALASLALAGCAAMAVAADGKVVLSGDQEVPAITTPASGSGTIMVGANKSVSGSVTTSGIAATAAHIHEAPLGKNGGVIIPLTKTSDNQWSVPAGAMLTDAQYKSYQAGGLYVNVHSDAHKNGEIRGQLKP